MNSKNIVTRRLRNRDILIEVPNNDQNIEQNDYESSTSSFNVACVENSHFPIKSEFTPDSSLKFPVYSDPLEVFSSQITEFKSENSMSFVANNPQIVSEILSENHPMCHAYDRRYDIDLVEPSKIEYNIYNKNFPSIISPIDFKPRNYYYLDKMEDNSLESYLALLLENNCYDGADDVPLIIALEIKRSYSLNQIELLQLSSSNVILMIHQSSGLLKSSILQHFLSNNLPCTLRFKLLFVGLEMTKTILYLLEIEQEINTSIDISSLLITKFSSDHNYNPYSQFNMLNKLNLHNGGYKIKYPDLSNLSNSDFNIFNIESYAMEAYLTYELGKQVIKKFYSRDLSRYVSFSDFRPIRIKIEKDVNKHYNQFEKIKSTLLNSIKLRYLKKDLTYVKIESITEIIDEEYNKKPIMIIKCSDYSNHIRSSKDQVKIVFKNAFETIIGELKLSVLKVEGKSVKLDIDEDSLKNLKSSLLSKYEKAQTIGEKPIRFISETWRKFQENKDKRYKKFDVQFVKENDIEQDFTLMRIEKTLVDILQSVYYVTSNSKLLNQCGNKNDLSYYLPNEFCNLLFNLPFDNVSRTILNNNNIEDDQMKKIESHRNYLNNSQYNSIINSLKYKISIIKGPPGTGKTRSIASIVDVVTGLEKRILIVAPGNAASRRILESIVNTGYKDACLVVSEDYFADWHEDSYHAGLSEYLFTKTSFKSELQEDHILNIDNNNNNNNNNKMKNNNKKSIKSNYNMSKWDKKNSSSPNVLIATYASITNSIYRNRSKLNNANNNNQRKAHNKKGNNTDNTELIETEDIKKELSELLLIDTIDMIIIDETSQLWSGYMFNFFSEFKNLKNVVLVGDEQQLPPYGSDQTEGINSLFDLAIDNKHIASVLLDISYRLTHPVVSIISNKVYNNQLKFHRVLETDLAFRSIINSISINFKINPIVSLILNNFRNDKNESSMMWIHSSNQMYINEKSKSSGNRGEAKIIVDCATSLLQCFDQSIKICILTPYNEQKRVIEDLLTRNLDQINFRGYNDYNEISSWVSSSLIVNTVDSFQGQEADIVLISTVKSSHSNKKKQSNSLGFSADQRRSNVMLTRASQILIIFGDAIFFNNQSIEQPGLLLPSLPFILSNFFKNSIFKYSNGTNYPTVMPYHILDDNNQKTNKNVKMDFKLLLDCSDNNNKNNNKESDLKLKSIPININYDEEVGSTIVLFISNVIYHIRNKDSQKVSLSVLASNILEHNRPDRSLIQSLQKFPWRFNLTRTNIDWFVELAPISNVPDKLLKETLYKFLEYISDLELKRISINELNKLSKMEKVEFQNIINYGIRSFCKDYGQSFIEIINFNIVLIEKKNKANYLFERIRNKASLNDNNNSSPKYRSIIDVTNNSSYKNIINNTSKDKNNSNYEIIKPNNKKKRSFENRDKVDKKDYKRKKVSSGRVVSFN